MAAGGDGANSGAQTAIWCGKCGIPYAADTVYCANCGAELAPLDVLAGALRFGLAAPSLATVAPDATEATTPDTVAPVAARPQECHSPSVVDAASVVTPTLAEVFPTPPPGLLGRVRQRQQSMSDVEVDAAAAAIIAQARNAEAGPQGPRDPLAVLAAFGPDPVVAAALQRRRERDRAWLIGGIVCCVLLILVALAVSRSMSVGLLRQ